MRTKHSIKSFISGLLALIIVIGTLPGMSVYAAQSNEYTDPADVWMEANGRTNELDMNATTTFDIQEQMRELMIHKANAAYLLGLEERKQQTIERQREEK